MISGAVNRVTFYCDGSCSGGTTKKPMPMGVGIVAIVDTHEGEFSEYVGLGTNQMAELHAVRVALESLPPDWDLPQTHVTIYTDSRYAIGIFTENWNPKTNLDIIVPVRSLIAKLGGFEMHHVPGHSGHALNTRADQLAALGARSGPVESTIVAVEEIPAAGMALIQEQDARIRSLVQALQYYGEPLTYLSPPGHDDQPPSIVADCGETARTVLAALGYAVTEDPFEERYQ